MTQIYNEIRTTLIGDCCRWEVFIGYIAVVLNHFFFLRQHSNLDP